MYKRKTTDEFQIWTNYGYGWEHESTCSTRQEAKQERQAYLDNAHTLIGIEIKKKRVKIEESETV
jgi:hypothetical protein